ncbi:hypothetical protein ACLI4Z_05885 [Natrialbaceae archaeon A-arb3/5]
MVAVGAPAAAAGEDVDDGAVHALDNGEELYLVFGAELDDMTLDEYIEAHASGDIDAEVSQYSDVNQVNINQQHNAVSIAIDGGEATAIQESNQHNDNEQLADSSAQNIQVDETVFEDVGTVNVVIGNGDGKHFDGWGVADKKGDKAEVSPDQDAEAVVTQAQEVAQLNYNEQNVAFALADSESEALAFQQSDQSNQNIQQGVANATNVYVGDGQFADKKGDHYKSDDSPGADQAASAEVSQGQAVDQTNYNEQDGAVAIAVGENSTATAIQLSDQTNYNEQVGEASATNIMSSMAGMHVATAGVDDSTIVDAEETMDSLHDDKHHDKKDDHKKDDKHHKKGDDAGQVATSEVTQEQGVEQMNVNLQSTALAIATNGSDATAVQLSSQSNYNAQVGFADALNVYANPGYGHDKVVQTSTTSVTVGGDEVEGIEGFAYDFDTQQKNDAEQDATAQLEQVQFLTQENVNQQQAAVAYADDGGSAGAAQVSLQENENVQFNSVAATNVWAAA